MTEDDEVHKPEGHIAGRGRAEGVIGIRIYEVPGEGFGVKLDTNDHGGGVSDVPGLGGLRDLTGDFVGAGFQRWERVPGVPGIWGEAQGFAEGVVSKYICGGIAYEASERLGSVPEDQAEDFAGEDVGRERRF